MEGFSRSLYYDHPGNLGQTIQVFFDTNDVGRDGGFHGTWQRRSNESWSGSFTVQCKFTAKVDKTIKLADLSDELAKARRLAASGLATNYILMTNARLTGAAELKIRGPRFSKFRKSTTLQLMGLNGLRKRFTSLQNYEC
jgi:hypothetical protein